MNITFKIKYETRWGESLCLVAGGRKYPMTVANTEMTDLILFNSTKSVTLMHTMTAPLNQSLSENLGNFIINPFLL